MSIEMFEEAQRVIHDYQAKHEKKRRKMARALRRIRDHEPRADRRKRYMVGGEEIETLQRIARIALQ